MYRKSKSCIETKDTRRGKRLSYLLRHGAEEQGLCIKPDGFIPVVEILQKLNDSTLDCTLGDLRRIVANDRKNRFTLQENDGVLEVKAHQGHSIVAVDQLNLKPIENPDFDIIHGTYLDHWPKIKTEGLSRMTRNHIHFAKNFNTDCGLRKNAEVYIYIDFEKATYDGLMFFESENGVVLSSGNADGIIEPKYFAKAVTKPQELLFPA